MLTAADPPGVSFPTAGDSVSFFFDVEGALLSPVPSKTNNERKS